MTPGKGPEWWANKISLMLDQVHGDDRFPVDVVELALDYSKSIFPDEPITSVKGVRLEGYDGALSSITKDGRREWKIEHDVSTSSKGRINFTVAHELGHYLVHRLDYPGDQRCYLDDMNHWDTEVEISEDEHKKIEIEANLFAARLLMPLNDFRKQIPASKEVGLKEIGVCAERYGVSLTAAAIQWLTYTEKRALLVASVDGFILWSISSRPAFKSGVFIKVKGVQPIPVPSASPTMSDGALTGLADPVRLSAGTWIEESVLEHSQISRKYNQNLSLLILANSGPQCGTDEEAEPDLVDKFKRR